MSFRLAVQTPCRVVEPAKGEILPSCSDAFVSTAQQQAVLLEVRRYPIEGNDALYGYVRFKDVDNRRSSWIAVQSIVLLTAAATSSGSAAAGSAVHPTSTMLSGVYQEVTEDMRRARELSGPLAFFDERLRRDTLCPFPIRTIWYVLNVSFSPWYYSPVDILYPAFQWTTTDVLYDAHICPFTLRFFTSRSALLFSWRQLMLPARRRTRGEPAAGAPVPSGTGSLGGTGQVLGKPFQPPGREVYRDDQNGFSLFEVCGRQERAITYGRNLFLLGKCFLENKLAGHDADLYVFYALCLHASRHTPWLVEMLQLAASQDSANDDRGGASAAATASLDAMVFAGYFSWEEGVSHDNLACIMVLPCFASLGIGNFLIASSYELSYRRGTTGSPERPLSDLGLSAYRSYWRDVLLQWLGLRVARVLEEEYQVRLSSDDDVGGTGAAAGGDAAHWPIGDDTAATLSQGRRARDDGLLTMYERRLARRAGTADSSVAGGTGVASRWQYDRRRCLVEQWKRCVDLLRFAVAAWAAAGRQDGTTTLSASRRSQGKRTAKAASVGRTKRRSLAGRVVGDTLDTCIPSSSESSSVASEASSDDSTDSGVQGARRSSGQSGVSPASKKFADDIRASSLSGELRLEIRVSVQEIAAEVMLDEADVLDCLLWCGLLHKGAFGGTTSIKVPMLLAADVIERRCLPTETKSSMFRFDPTRISNSYGDRRAKRKADR